MTNDMNIKNSIRQDIANADFVRSKFSAAKNPVSGINTENNTASDQYTRGIEGKETDKLSTPKNLDKLSKDEKLQEQKNILKNETSDSREKLDDVVTSLNTSIQAVQRNLEFKVDKDLDRIVINVTDKETDEVVRQIPSEDILELARNLQEMAESKKDKASGSGEGVFFSSSA